MLLPVPVDISYEIKPAQEEVKIIETAHKLACLETGMTLEELKNLVTYIETLKKSNYFDEPYLRKEVTLAPRTIEIDPKTKRVFIHLKTHNVSQVGKGYHKRVTRSILYDQSLPKFVAAATVKDSKQTRREIDLLEKFENLDGIIKPIFISQHAKKAGNLVTEIITPLYNKGSLRSFIKKHPKTVPLATKCSIAKDILLGACNLNKQGYISRDNNKGNFFIHEEEGVYHTVIGDIGGYTDPVDIALKRKPFGPSFRTSPPDLHLKLYEGSLQAQDLYSCHVYALGRAIYYLLFEEDVPWVEGFKEKYPLISNLYKDMTNPDVLLEIEALKNEIDSFTNPRIEELAISLKNDTIQPHELFEYAVLNMLSTSSMKREKNTFWLETFTKLERIAQSQAIVLQEELLEHKV